MVLPLEDLLTEIPTVASPLVRVIAVSGAGAIDRGDLTERDRRARRRRGDGRRAGSDDQSLQGRHRARRGAHGHGVDEAARGDRAGAGGEVRLLHSRADGLGRHPETGHDRRLEFDLQLHLLHAGEGHRLYSGDLLQAGYDLRAEESGEFLRRQ